MGTLPYFIPVLQIRMGNGLNLGAVAYSISSVIRWGLFSFQNNPKGLDPSYKTDLDLSDCLGRVKLAL